MKKIKEVKGITLVALIVTVVILLILSGISIGIIISNSLLDRAKLAKEIYKNVQNLEDTTLSNYENTIEEVVNISASREQISSQGNPAGTVISYMGTIAPEGYLICDGTEYNISDYKNLADQIKTNFGSYENFGGDGTTTFAVPNLQGEFLRGTGTNSHTNQGSGRNVGLHQDATEVLNFTGYGSNESYLIQRYAPANTSIFRTNNGDSNIGTASGHWINYANSGHNTNTSSISPLITTRPTNTSVLYCIKY